MKLRKRATYRFSNGLISNRNRPRRSQNKVVSTNIAMSIENSLEAKLEAFSEVGENWIEITIPMITASEGNGGLKKSFKKDGKVFYTSEHWSEKNRRHKLQKGNIFLMLRPLRSYLHLPCVIILTRYAPKKLGKFDNLPMAFKYILDAICEVITSDYRPGRADDLIEDEIDVLYKQVISEKYAVKIKIEMVKYVCDKKALRSC